MVVLNGWSGEIVEDSPSEKKAWALTQEAFEKLLVRLDADRERAGEKYEAIRRKLARFFEWRGGAEPEELADETINRITRRIDEGEEVHDLSGYFQGVARKLLMETLKDQKKQHVASEHLPLPVQTGEDSGRAEPRLQCLEKCMQSLPAENQELIVEYYQADRRVKIERRKRLAERLGMSLNALRIRAHRIRAKLEACGNECLKR